MTPDPETLYVDPENSIVRIDSEIFVVVRVVELEVPCVKLGTTGMAYKGLEINKTKKLTHFINLEYSTP